MRLYSRKVEIETLARLESANGRVWRETFLVSQPNLSKAWTEDSEGNVELLWLIRRDFLWWSHSTELIDVPGCPLDVFVGGSLALLRPTAMTLASEIVRLSLK